MPNQTIADAPEITSTQIATITRDVWRSLLTLELSPAEAADDQLHHGPVISGSVHLDGDWQGSVLLHCAASHAQAAAEAMFGTEDLTADEVQDAWGELTNIVAGGIKNLMPGAPGMSSPSVTAGDAAPDAVAESGLLHRVTLAGVAGAVQVSVCLR